MIQHILNYYEEIDNIDLEENDVKIMGTYDPTEPLVQIIKKPEKG